MTNGLAISTPNPKALDFVDEDLKPYLTANLGADLFFAYRRITLPLILPGILFGAISLSPYRSTMWS